MLVTWSNTMAKELSEEIPHTRLQAFPFFRLPVIFDACSSRLWSDVGIQAKKNPVAEATGFSVLKLDFD